MTVDLNLYRRVVKPLLATALDLDPERNPEDVISEISRVTNCHIIAVTYYAVEILGNNGKLEKFLVSLFKFYRPVEVINEELRNG